MVQILQRNDPWQTLGAGLGTGISGGLQQLANQKIQDLQAKQLVPGLQTIWPNYNQSQLESLARQDPRILNQLIKQQTALRSEEPINRAAEDIISGKEPQTIQQQLQKTPEEQYAAKALEKISEIPIKVSTKLPPGALADQEQSRLENYISSNKLSPSQADKVREKLEKRADRFEKQQEKIDKATNEWNSKVTEARKGAEENNIRLQTMKQDISEGNLPHPTTATILDAIEKGILGFGINLKPLFYSASAQEFEKTAKDFVKGAKKFFGAKLTDLDLRTILQTVPSLTNTTEGKLRLINNLERMNSLNIEEARIRDEIIAANGGYRPHNIESLVEKRMDPIIQKSKEDLVNDFKKVSSNKSQPDVLKNTLGGAGAGAATGAAAGSFFPGVGTGIGAGLGGLLGGLYGYNKNLY